jgi:hypothetical protein
VCVRGAVNLDRSRLSAGWTRWKAGPRPELAAPHRELAQLQRADFGVGLVFVDEDVVDDELAAFQPAESG